MLCIFVERYFESLICWLDLCLSSLLVAFISICFSSLWKTSFLQARQLLDRSLTDSLLSSPSFSFSWRILDPSRFLGFSSIDSRQLLRSIEPNFWALCLADRFSIQRGDFSIDRSSTAPQQIHFCRDLVLDRPRQIPRSIELWFLYIVEAQSGFHFLTSLIAT